MSSIYEQGIYSNCNCSGVFVWHDVYHVSQNTKLQSVADRPGPGILLLVRVPWMMPADSAELRHTHRKKEEMNTKTHVVFTTKTSTSLTDGFKQL